VSYRQLEPPDHGGPDARRGFEFQDHVAIFYLAEMLTSPTLVEVWCETLDDLTLVWCEADKEIFEFVQAKNHKLDQLWSIAMLCQRPKTKGMKKHEASIIEKSLSHDQGREACRFRLVTSMDFKSELTPLTLPLTSPARTKASEAFLRLQSRMATKLKGIVSPNEHDVQFWLSRAVCAHVGKAEAVEAQNMLRLRAYGEAKGFGLSQDQWTRLYRLLLHRVREAGGLPWNIDPEDKKFKKAEFAAWLGKEAKNLGLPPMTKGTVLRKKMVGASIAKDKIEAALELRRHYRMRALDPGYLDLSARKSVEADAFAVLHRLLSSLDADPNKPEGERFLSECLEELNGLAKSFAKRSEGIAPYLYGYMYEVADRCLHRFSRRAA
jgi:hypothetical protein